MTHQNRSKKKWSSIRSYLKAAHTSQYAKYYLPFKRSEWWGRRFLSLCALTVLVPFIFSRTVLLGLCGGKLAIGLRWHQPVLLQSAVADYRYLFMCSSTFGLGWELNSSGIINAARAKMVYSKDMLECLSLKARLHGNTGNPLNLQERCFA